MSWPAYDMSSGVAWPSATAPGWAAAARAIRWGAVPVRDLMPEAVFRRIPMAVCTTTPMRGPRLGSAMNGVSTGGVLEVDPHEAKTLVDQGQAGLLDVREPQEWTNARIDGSVHLPMMQVPERLEEIRRDQTWVVVCHSGARSMQIARFLQAQGYEDVMNLKGGIVAWHQSGLPIQQG